MMSDWELVRKCFCFLWFGQLDSKNSTSAGGSTSRQSDTHTDVVNYSSEDEQCAYILYNADTSFTPSYANVIEDALYTRVVTAVCCFGLLGNAVNLVVLSTQMGQMGRMQQFARIGLMSLAIADALVCLSILPHAFVERDPVTTYVGFSLVYSAYGEPVINVFAMIGTWLTVAMATGRYAAVCHPFRARAAIGRTVALRLIVLVSTGCILFNIPRFFRNSVDEVTCLMLYDQGRTPVNQTWYFRWIGPLHTHRHRHLEFAYIWVYFLVAVVVPLAVLIYTGLRLACSLRRDRFDGAGAEERAAQTTETGRYQDLDRSFTLTFVAVALMHIVLVSPAELLNFARGHLLGALLDSNPPGYEVYNLLASVLNTLQAANYSFNFLLYCAVNVAFRRRFVELVSCRSQTAVQNRLRLQMVANSGLLDRSSVGSTHRPRRSGTSRDREYRVTLSDPIY